MTISTTTNRVTYTGNGVTVAFSFPYAFFTQADLVVIETVIATGVQTTKTITTHYTISGSVDALGHYSSGGTVTAVAAPASTVTWTIYRDPTATQTTDLVENDPMPAESIEAALDYQTMLNQRTRDIAARSLQQPEGDSATIGRLPAKVARASQYLGFDANGDPTALAAPTSTSLTTAFTQTLLDDATAADARATLGLDVAAKGDLFAATANDTLTTLAVGTTTGHALVVDPAASAGLSYGPRSHPNPIVNGNMEIWQRGATFGAVTTGTYTADRWKWYHSGAGVVTINRSTNVPTVAQAGVLFNYSLEVDVTTADASIAAGDYYTLKHVLEGYNWRHFAQRDCTLSFWVRSPKTGVHGVSFSNAGSNQSLVATYTVNVADTWEFKTIAIPASPSAGTWDYTTGYGLGIEFALSAGATYQTAVTAWQATGPYLTNASQVNVLDNTANFFRLTGVKMELGSVATPIQYVPFESELARCLRYYQKSFPYAVAPADNLNVYYWQWSAMAAGAVVQESPYLCFPVLMRTTPVITVYQPLSAGATGQGANITDNAALTGTQGNGITERGFTMIATGTAGTAVNERLSASWAADAEL